MNKDQLPGVFSKPLKSKPIEWSAPPIKVISLGCGSHAVLDKKAIDDIATAEIIFGSNHHLLEISEYTTFAKKHPFPSPFSELRDQLDSNQQLKTVVLASGDALFYGVGNWLTRLIGSENLVFRPNVSSIQYSFHAIGLPWQQAEIVSLHGRPLHSLRRHIRSNQLLGIFTDAKSNPKVIANEICSQGYSSADVWVCEAMGQDTQTVTHYSAKELAKVDGNFHDLNICIVKLGELDTVPKYPLPGFPGIQDAYFATGAEPGFGMISKREVRLSILSLMSPENGEIAWDIGAGCGSVSVEWARWNKLGQIYAIEQSEDRIEHIITNSERFGTTLNLTPIQGAAGDCCDALPAPDCIFIGGSSGLAEMLEYAWQRLSMGGKLVASAVTETSKQALAEFVENKVGREWLEVGVTKNLPNQTENRILQPVAIAKCIKTAVSAS